MKTVLILRHAKSSWADERLDDHDRPLNARGEKAAPLMGRWAARQRALPDVILCSTALRARRTAELFAAAAALDAPTRLVADLYLADPDSYTAVLRELADDVERAMLVGHNPGLEELVERLSGRDERMPTAALAVIELPVDTWRDVDSGTRGSLIAVWRPKEL